MKKVIFVGGTAYSGSTFLDMTLGNDSRGFSVGEVNYLYNPVFPHHGTPVCGCGNTQCRFWDGFRDIQPTKLYEEIFHRLPNIEFIVDSSKNPHWIRRQSASLKRSGIECKHILIWKTPTELADSFKKRGRFMDWKRSWINYHRTYIAATGDWSSVMYQKYLQSSTALEHICKSVGIPFFVGKERFWEKQHHLLFGNDSARVHLGGEGRELQDRKSYEAQLSSSIHRQLYYRPPEDSTLIANVSELVERTPEISDIIKILHGRDVDSGAQINASESRLAELEQKVRISRLNFAAREFRYSSRSLVNRLRFHRHI